MKCKSIQKKIKLNSLLYKLLFIIASAGLSQILFSGLGFNPTDDGFTLSYSRRILDGQIPHLDFIIIRPFLSPLIHVPVVAFGGQYTFYLSRFIVWIQFAVISVLLIRFIIIYADLLVDRKIEIFFYLITFITAAHTFPIMAWHTIDGLMIALIGLNLLLNGSKFKRNLGFIFLGLAYLCKQSYLPVGFLFLLFNSNWKKLGNWLSFLSPIFFYLLILRLFGIKAFEEGIIQIISQTNFLSIIKFYLESYWLFAGIASGIIMWLSINKFKNKIKLIVTFILIFIILLILLGNLIGTINKISLYFGGVFIVLTLVYLNQQKNLANKSLQAYLIIVILGISVSISIGYPYPVFVTGGLLLLIYEFLCRNGYRIKINKWILTIIALLIISSFIYSRFTFIYRESNAKQINYDLGEILPGASLIKTNVSTYKVLADLNKITKSISNQKKKYAIIPDNAGYWAKATQQNPLSIDWVYEVELNKNLLIDRIIHDLENKRDSIFIIVQKYDSEFIAKEFISVNYANPIIKYVRQKFDLVYETRYYYIYK